MGRLLDDLSRKMSHKADHGDKDVLKILVCVMFPSLAERKLMNGGQIHSTHDTALAGLASTLDVFDER